jgi:L-ascorbate metabolism protein UlaG (beta-lactamase superfamily)
MKLLYLKPNIIAEPLIWRWYAWSHLIPPATAGCNLAERYLKIMQSYVQAPQVHAQAIKNPDLIGGPFIDLNGENVDEIKDLIQETKENCKVLLDLSHSIKDFSRFLQNEQGDTLEQHYKKLPENLRGLVELVYDLNNNASIKLIEPLFYNKYYNTSFQSIALSETFSDHRPFIMSTPNLKKDNQVVLNVPFNDKRLDLLFSMRMNPKYKKEIENVFKINDEEQELFWSFFTEEKPEYKNDREYTADGVRIRYFGHACILLQTDDVSVLIDPVISYKVSGNIPRFTLEDLPDVIDYVVLTHNHQDHVLFESLLQLRHKVKHVVCPPSNNGFLADPSLKLILEKLGFSSIYILNDFEKIYIAGGEIMGLPFLGEHSDLNIHSKIAHFITLKDRKFIFAADSNNLDPDLYINIFDYIGAIDVLFVGMECDGAPLSWLYGPLITNQLKRSYDNARTLSGSDFNKAWSIVKQSQCKQAYVYAMGQEPWLNYIMALQYTPDSIQMTESDRFIIACHKSNIKSERLYGKKEWVVV